MSVGLVTGTGANPFLATPTMSAPSHSLLAQYLVQLATNPLRTKGITSGSRISCFPCPGMQHNSDS